MWFRTRSTTRSRTARGAWSRSRKAPGEPCPDRVVPQEVAVGERRRLADVVEQGGQPDDRSRPAGAASTDRSVWSQRSSSGTLFWGIPRWAASSAEIAASTPVSLIRRSPTDGSGRGEQPVELGRDPLAGQVRDEARARLDPGERGRLDARSRASPRAGRPGPSAGRPPRSGPAGRRRRAGACASTSARPSYGSTRPGSAARPGAPGHRVDGEVAAGEVQLDRAR